MATAVNPITGNLIKSKTPTDQFRANWTKIDWSKKVEPTEKKEEQPDSKITQK